MRIRVAVIGLILFAAVGLFPRRAESPLRASQAPADFPLRASQAPVPAPLPSVTIEHDFVRIAPTTRMGAPYRKIAAPAKRPPAPRVSNSLLARAARAVLGDGRHRPEPFPRPGR
jgi:hypothetical protein